jgi:hypothetical protein
MALYYRLFIDDVYQERLSEHILSFDLIESVHLGEDLLRITFNNSEQQMKFIALLQVQVHLQVSYNNNHEAGTVSGRYVVNYLCEDNDVIIIEAKIKCFGIGNTIGFVSYQNATLKNILQGFCDDLELGNPVVFSHNRYFTDNIMNNPIQYYSQEGKTYFHALEDLAEIYNAIIQIKDNILYFSDKTSLQRVEIDSVEIDRDKSILSNLQVYRGVMYTESNLLGQTIEHTIGQEEYFKLNKNVPNELISRYMRSMFEKITSEINIMFFRLPCNLDLQAGVVFRYFENASIYIPETYETLYRIERVALSQDLCCVKAINISRRLVNDINRTSTTL